MSASTVLPKGPQTVAEFVRSWTAQEKEAVIAELIREAVQISGGSWVMPLTAPDGEQLGVFVPQAVVPISLKTPIPTLTAEQRAETQAALDDLSRTFDPLDYLDELNRRDQG